MSTDYKNLFLTGGMIYKTNLEGMEKCPDMHEIKSPVPGARAFEWNSFDHCKKNACRINVNTCAIKKELESRTAGE